MGSLDPLNAPRTSWASSEAIRRTMQGNRGRDTAPELALRRAVHALGLRYRVGVRPLSDLRRTADLVFPRERVAVYMHGCYWHGCIDHFKLPATNQEYWRAKVDRNRERDQETEKRLVEAGWLPIVVWEHDDLPEAARRIQSVVTQRRAVGRLDDRGVARLSVPPPG